MGVYQKLGGFRQYCVIKFIFDCFSILRPLLNTNISGCIEDIIVLTGIPGEISVAVQKDVASVGP